MARVDEVRADDADSHDDDQEHRERAGGHRRDLTQRGAETAEDVADPFAEGPPALDAQPQLVLEAAARPRRLECVVELTLQRL